MKTYTQSELAVELGKHRSTINKWIKEGCPFIEKGDRGRGKEWKFSLPAVVEWLQTRATESVKGNTSQINLEEAKRRKIAAEAETAELELAQKSGALVPMSDVKTQWERQLTNIRQRILALEPRAPLIRQTASDNEARAVLGNMLREVLNGFARYGSGGTADGADTDDEESGEGET